MLNGASSKMPPPWMGARFEYGPPSGFAGVGGRPIRRAASWPNPAGHAAETVPEANIGESVTEPVVWLRVIVPRSAAIAGAAVRATAAVETAAVVHTSASARDNRRLLTDPHPLVEVDDP